MNSEWKRFDIPQLRAKVPKFRHGRSHYQSVLFAKQLYLCELDEEKYTLSVYVVDIGKLTRKCAENWKTYEGHIEILGEVKDILGKMLSNKCL